MDCINDKVYDYSELLGKMRSQKITQEELAKRIHLSETIYDVAGSETPFNTNGKLAISYRGMENPWGNIWKHTNGINLQRRNRG